MDIKDTIKRLRNRDLGRRDFNKALAAVGLSAAMMPMAAKPSRGGR